jgi:hypothetical protein
MLTRVMRWLGWQRVDNATAKIVGEVTGGMVDLIFAYGVTLTSAGLVTRDQLAEGFDELVRQIEATGGSEARLYLPRAFALLFKKPGVGERRFRVVGDDPPDSAA